MNGNKGICPYCDEYKTTIMDRNVGHEIIRCCFECYTNHVQQLATHGESILDRIRRLWRE